MVLVLHTKPSIWMLGIFMQLSTECGDKGQPSVDMAEPFS
jgi:hypothetical protein